MAGGVLLGTGGDSEHRLSENTGGRSWPERLGLLAEASAAIIDRTTVAERLAEITRQAAICCHCRQAAVSLEVGGRSVSHATNSLPPAIDRVLEQASSWTAPRSSGDDVALEMGWTAIPLHLGARRIRGAIVAFDRAPGWDASDAVVLGQLAHVCLPALDVAVVHEEVQRSVRVLQRGLLPETARSVPGLGVASRYRSASRRSAIGGDWHDIVSLEDDRLVAVVGDVMGHGIDAAMVMGRLRTGLLAYLVEGHDMRHAVELLGRLLEYAESGHLATLILAELQISTGRLRILSAGHPPPLLVRRDGSTELLTTEPSPPIGVGLGGVDREVRTEILAPGETLLLYTDGLVEGLHRPIDDGIAELVRLASRPSGEIEDIECLCDYLMDEMVSTRPEDDVCLVTLRLE
jgi:hypothetical protein